MKKLILTILILCVPSLAFAGTWCQWEGATRVNCKSTNKTSIFITDHLVTVSAENLNPRGWFELITTQPTIGADQVRGAEIETKPANEILLTWAVDDMTAQEIQNRADEIAAQEGLISRELYYVLNCFLKNGSIDVVNGKLNPAGCPQKLKDAYSARGRLEAQ